MAAQVIQFPRKSLEQRMDEIIREFDRETDGKYTPDESQQDRILREYFRALVALGSV